ISPSVVETTEGSGNPIIFNVNLDRITSQNITVNFQLSGAASSSDYVIKSGSQVITNSITIPAGFSFAPISIYANTDSVPEGDESISVQLTGVSSGAQLGGPVVATATIHDVAPVSTPDDYRDSLTDTTAPFGQVAVGGSVVGVVAPELGDVNGDKDWFELDGLQQGHTYRITLQGMPIDEHSGLPNGFFTVRD